MFSNSTVFTRVISFAVLLALIVIVLGAYTRLSDSGLGCPDWPGCYGHLGVPDKVSTEEYQRPLEVEKAWGEMIHRYVAGTLGLVILLIVFMVIKGRQSLKQGIVLPVILLGTVVFQALLGMWTVTMLLSPIIVTAHLLGGFTTLSLLWWLFLNQKNSKISTQPSSVMKILAFVGLVIVIVQIFLGGWTSTNYAALACGTDFPTCAKVWWPIMDFANGFSFQHETGKDYEFGVLESPARTAIQFVHRVGALLVFLYLSIFSYILIRKNEFKNLGYILIVVLITQVSLGIMNVVLGLPLLVAVLHTLVAALLLLTIIAINYRTLRSR